MDYAPFSMPKVMRTSGRFDSDHKLSRTILSIVLSYKYVD